MNRGIRGWRTDEDGHQVAVLDCGHGRHYRHAPPGAVRPWVLDPAARQARLGTVVACLNCDRRELPAGAIAYKHTRWFTEDTVPKAILANQSTRAWGVVEVEHGAVQLESDVPPAFCEVATPTHAVVLAPGHLHRAVIIGPVRFRVGFHRVERPDSAHAPPPGAVR